MLALGALEGGGAGTYVATLNGMVAEGVERAGQYGGAVLGMCSAARSCSFKAFVRRALSLGAVHYAPLLLVGSYPP